MKGTKTIYICTECEQKSPKWLGRCPACGAWNSFVEDVIEAPTAASVTAANRKAALHASMESDAVAYEQLDVPSYMRCPTGMNELDRVLGSGGLVTGSVILLAGEPGIGKSTLLMQICDALGQGHRVLYISGEESGGQLKLRAKRLGVVGKNLFILTETHLEHILTQVDKLKPDFIIVDSIQTIYTDTVNSTAGSVTQVKECTLAFIAKAKANGISVLLVGHVNKEGGIAGPKVLEHMVDAVLYFEGERQQSYRMIRAMKNRYGSTNEIGVFEMTDNGFIEVSNPSEMLLMGRPKNTSGNCAVCTIEGTRPLIAEVQALVTPTAFSLPRRTNNGMDYNRVCLILAILEKRLGLRFSQHDVYLNVIGGLHVDEPAADCAIALSLISSLTDRVIPDDLVAIGELGLSGECRAVSNVEQRVKEAMRLGFRRVIVPHRNVEKRPCSVEGVEIIPIRTIYDTLKILKKQDQASAISDKETE